MGFNSKAFLADRERLLEPDQVHGTRKSKWHQDQHTVHTVLVLPPPEYRTEQELQDIEDDHLAKHGII